MGSMGYCKFRNAYKDLSVIAERWDETPDNNMDEEELKARKQVINLCCDIALDYGHEIGREFEEL